MIKSKNLFLLFSQVTTFSIFFYFSGPYLLYLDTYSKIYPQPTTFSLTLSITVSRAQFAASRNFLVALHCQSTLPSPISAHEAVSSLSLLPRRCTSAVLSRLNSYIFKHFDGFFFIITHKGPKITHTKYKAGWP